jgi:Protein of unknown function (DUF1214)
MPERYSSQNGFSSITMYMVNDGWWFKPNPLNKFTVSPRDGLKTNPDGSTTLYFQVASPGAVKEANWLPAPRDSLSRRCACTGQKMPTRRFATAAGVPRRSLKLKAQGRSGGGPSSAVWLLATQPFSFARRLRSREGRIVNVCVAGGGMVFTKKDIFFVALGVLTAVCFTIAVAPSFLNSSVVF